MFQRRPVTSTKSHRDFIMYDTSHIHLAYRLGKTNAAKGVAEQWGVPDGHHESRKRKSMCDILPGLITHKYKSVCNTKYVAWVEPPQVPVVVLNGVCLLSVHSRRQKNLQNRQDQKTILRQFYTLGKSYHGKCCSFRCSLSAWPLAWNKQKQAAK